MNHDWQRETGVPRWAAPWTSAWVAIPEVRRERSVEFQHAERAISFTAQLFHCARRLAALTHRAGLASRAPFFRRRRRTGNSAVQA
jgi:hypothetical protein